MDLNESGRPGKLAVPDHESGEFYTGDIHACAEWPDVAGRFGWCALDFGHIGPPDLDQPDSEHCRKALRVAVDSGGVADARPVSLAAPVRRPG